LPSDAHLATGSLRNHAEYCLDPRMRREQAVRRVQERLFGSQEKKGPTVASLKIARDCAG